MTIFMIAVAGVIGVLARFGLNIFVLKNLSTAFPLATFLANCLGSFLIGVFYVLGIERIMIPPSYHLAISVGLLGGFTTFSTYSLDVLSNIERGHGGLALIYVLLTNLVCLASTGLALSLTRKILGAS